MKKTAENTKQSSDCGRALCLSKRGTLCWVEGRGWAQETCQGGNGSSVARGRRANRLAVCRKAREFGLAFCSEAGEKPHDAATATGSPVHWFSGVLLSHCPRGHPAAPVGAGGAP